MFMDKQAYNPGEAYLVDAGAQTQKVRIPYQMVAEH
jgi:hypothetical protein